MTQDELGKEILVNLLLNAFMQGYANEPAPFEDVYGKAESYASNVVKEMENVG